MVCVLKAPPAAKRVRREPGEGRPWAVGDAGPEKHGLEPLGQGRRWRWGYRLDIKSAGLCQFVLFLRRSPEINKQTNPGHLPLQTLERILQASASKATASWEEGVQTGRSPATSLCSVGSPCTSMAATAPGSENHHLHTFHSSPAWNRSVSQPLVQPALIPWRRQGNTAPDGGGTALGA